MLLVKAEVGPFRSINNPQNVTIESRVTALVGMNEAGKTVFLKALEKANDALDIAKFDPTPDYPRKDLPTYLKKHNTSPVKVVELTYELNSEDVNEINRRLNTSIKPGFQFSVNHLYNNKRTINISINEQPVIKSLISNKALSSDVQNALNQVSSISEIPSALQNISLTEKDKEFLQQIEERIKKSPWNTVVSHEAWQIISQMIPKFLYFSDYEILPSKMNLKDLANHVALAKTDSKQFTSQYRGTLALLRMADIDIEDFTKTGGYEPLKAKIEGVSINLTDQIMEFWKQNEDIEVEIDIKPDPEDQAPYNDGPNLYLRIKNRRHRGVSTPFQQRSRGFIWFFSFLVWFDSVQHQMEMENGTTKGIILLLDEPGLNLHALAQMDFLRYLEDLSEKHQILYSTHSPFLVDSNNLSRVRVVEDKIKEGTVISENMEGSDPRTIFPLQAALGWTVAQNLFISERNLLVEGPSELIYFKAISSMLEAKNRTSLREDITIVPVGGLDKVVTFVSLLGANGLKLVVLHDYQGRPEQKLDELVRQKIIQPKLILNASQFRDLSKIGTDTVSSDTKDIFEPSTYLSIFNKAFAKQLKGVSIAEADLPAGDRIIKRIEQYLVKKKITIRPSGGFNHYAVATYFASNPNALDKNTLSRFEALFHSVNNLV